MQLEHINNKKDNGDLGLNFLTEPKLVQTGKININKISKFLKLSEVITFNQIDKSNQEILNQRASLLRMREKFLIENGLTIKELTIYANQEFVKVYVLTSFNDCADLHYLRSILNDIYTKRNTSVNFTDFHYDTKGYYDFWWDIENDLMWSLNKEFMEQFITNIVFNSCDVMKTLSIEDVLLTQEFTQLKDNLSEMFLPQSPNSFQGT